MLLHLPLTLWLWAMAGGDRAPDCLLARAGDTREWAVVLSPGG